MSRFRLRRGRLAALAVLPFVLITTVTIATTSSPSSSAEASANGGQLRSSKAVVRVGNRLVLRGQFAGASNRTVQIQRRPPGVDRWRNVTRTQTGPEARYRVRFNPRRTFRWRALLLPEEPVENPNALARPSGGEADRTAGPARVRVRSRTRARTVKRHVRARQRTRVAGRVRPNGRRKVVIRAAGRRVTTRTGRGGYFSARIPITRPGIFPVRVRATGNRRALRSGARAGRVTAYRAVGASWYGPGFYGRRTACGQTLTQSTRGTAHRSLPCGTRLRLRHGGRTATVRVIDRGPYVGGRELDLTYATKRELGFGSTGTVLMSR